jgi:hypothetical protein
MQPVEPFQECDCVFALEFVVQKLDAVSKIIQRFVGFDPADQPFRLLAGGRPEAPRLSRLSTGGTQLPRSRGLLTSGERFAFRVQQGTWQGVIWDCFCFAHPGLAD